MLVGTGSACKSRGARISAVLLEMGVPNDYAQGAIRLSLSARNTMEEVEETLRILPEVVGHLRKYIRR